MDTLFPGVASSDLAGRAAKVLTPNYRPAPLVLVRGRGCQVEDRDGNVYLDMVGGIAVNALGHAHPRLVAAIADQAAHLLHVSNLYLNEPIIALAERLVAISFADRVFFANSGAEANEAALKLARRYQSEIVKSPDKVGVLAFHESFHGRTYGALSATGQPKYHHGFEPLVPGIRFAAYGDLGAVERELATPRDGLSVGIIMLEPIQCEGGIHVPTTTFLAGIRELADRHGAVVIYDEVQTGVGRTGRWWCYEHGGGAPDIMTTAKGIAGGVPLGVMLASDKLAQGFTAGSHASTFGGNALATRASLEVLQVIEDDGLLANAALRGAELAAGLQRFVRRYPDHCIEQRGLGLVQGLELASAALATAVVDGCKARGMLLNAVQGKTLRFVPPLIVSAAEIEQALAHVEAVLAVATQAERDRRVVNRTPARASSNQATLADEWDAIHTILAPLLAETGAAERRSAVLARYNAPRLGATLGEVDQLIDQLIVRMRTEPKPKLREDTRPHPRVPTQPPTGDTSDKLPRVQPAGARPPTGKPITRPTDRPELRPADRPLERQPERPEARQAEPPLPPPIPIKPPTRPAMPTADELDGMPPLPPVDAAPKKRPTGVRPAVGHDESGPIVPARPATAPETYQLYDDIVNLSGLNDWDGVLISLERLLVLAKLEDHIKEFVDANEVKLLSIYETFLKSFGRVPRRLPPAFDNSMPRPFLRAEKIAAVLGMIDGEASIQELLRRSPLSPLETCSALCQLRRSGIVEVP